MNDHTHFGKWFYNFVIVFFLALIAFSCASEDDDDSSDNVADDDTEGTDDTTSTDDTSEWEPVPPHRETIGGYTVVWLSGTPYEMGRQQGTLLHSELAAGIDWLQQWHLVDLIVPVARALGLTDLAMSNSYQDVIDECQGLVDSAGDVGWSMDVCILLNFGDILVEFLSYGFPPAKDLAPGCSEAAAMGDATADGRLYHGRILDWSKIDYLLDYPVIFVRQPEDGIPHVFVGFPANLSPYTGMNIEGVSIGSNEADPVDENEHDRVGHSHVQMIAQMLKSVHGLDEAEDYVTNEDHMTVELIMVADGEAQDAAVFEMTAKHLGIRRPENGILYATNHFVAPETVDSDEDPAGESTTKRFMRWSQLLEPDGSATNYGSIDKATMIAMMRDRVDPVTGEEYGVDVFDNNSSIATNGALFEVLFDPEKKFFWVAAGTIPVPQQTFVGFSLPALLGYSDAEEVDPPTFE